MNCLMMYLVENNNLKKMVENNLPKNHLTGGSFDVYEKKRSDKDIAIDLFKQNNINTSLYNPDIFDKDNVDNCFNIIFEYPIGDDFVDVVVKEFIKYKVENVTDGSYGRKFKIFYRTIAIKLIKGIVDLEMIYRETQKYKKHNFDEICVIFDPELCLNEDEIKDYKTHLENQGITVLNVLDNYW